jgi:hypothetical protein
MPKNKGKGGKNRRRGKNQNDDEKREIILKEEGQEYAQVSFLSSRTSLFSWMTRVQRGGHRSAIPHAFPSSKSIPCANERFMLWIFTNR